MNADGIFYSLHIGLSQGAHLAAQAHLVLTLPAGFFD